MGFVIGVDIGGTCTDCVVLDTEGRISVAKAFSTPPDFASGIFDALAVAAGALKLSVHELLARTAMFLHSTSIAENAIVDGTLSKAGLLTTRGFEETLYMTRGGYGRWSGLSEEAKKNVIGTDKPPTLIPLSLVRGITERTDEKGAVLTTPDDEEVRAAVRVLLDRGAQSIGICFLWSFRNSSNEQRVKELISRLHPDVFVTASSDVAPLEGEYERSSTIALNARLGPIVSSYLQKLQHGLEAQGYVGRIFVMQSHGGLLPLEQTAERAVGMIESGPIGGLVGSKVIGELLRQRNILATDMGGTTFKVGAIRDGLLDYEREPMVLRYHYSLHKMEMVSIGIAGGSIISVEPRTRIPKLGPRSAGASPGPACYGFGGKEPTITDVDLILGYLNPGFFLGGRASLNRQKAMEVFKKSVADPLEMEVMEAAASVYRLANSMIYDLLHKQTVEKGLDPREYVMFAYGGTAGMHMTAIAQELGISSVVVPYSASVHGAFGVVSADVVRSEVSIPKSGTPYTAADVNNAFTSLGKRVVQHLTNTGFPAEDVVLQRYIDIRYRRQVHVVNTPVPGVEPLTESQLRDVYSRFENQYAERYGAEAGYREAGIELVAFIVRGHVSLPKPSLLRKASGPHDPSPAYVETRTAYFPSVNSFQPARCYDFDRLLPGNNLNGPAIVWTPVTTVVVNPGQSALCDGWKNLVITWKAQ